MTKKKDSEQKKCPKIPKSLTLPELVPLVSVAYALPTS